MNSLNISTVKSTFGKYIIYFVLLFLIVALSLMSPYFLTPSNISNVLRQISTTSIVALGMTFVIIAGGIDLSVGNVVALCGVVSASFAHPGEYPLIVSILISMAIGLIIGLANGFIIAKAKIVPFIVTLGTFQICRGLAMTYTGGRPVGNISSEYKFIGQGLAWGIPVPILIFAFLTIVSAIILHKTKIGRYIYAVGGNELAARLSGINIFKIKLFVYSYIGLLTGISAIVLTARVSSGAPNAAQGYELDAISACVIGGTSMSGGRGSIWGTIVGALIIGVVNNGLDLLNVSSYTQSVVKGIIIITALLLDKLGQKSKE
ncbi:MAG: ABC transporter permease [Tepidanaerobacteraceae bacterium]|nr:ABC transporter permease [Thermoanaerobacterales bacterium]